LIVRVDWSLSEGFDSITKRLLVSNPGFIFSANQDN
jgi:hypothetical protein